MHRRILVPIDAGEGSRLPLERAVDPAVPANADVHLLAVAEPPDGPLPFDVETVEGIDRAIEELAEAVLSAGNGPEDRVEFRTAVRRHASPTTATLAYAAEVEADLGVVGRRATGGRARARHDGAGRRRGGGRGRPPRAPAGEGCRGDAGDERADGAGVDRDGPPLEER